MLTEERRRILNLVADGKLTAEQADKLLEALSSQPAQLTPSNTSDAANLAVSDPKYLRVLVEGYDDEHPGTGKVNVRVPFTLIRAGMRLAALLPATVHEPINRALRDNGVDIDISKIKPENLEDLVTHLRELAVDVDGARGEKVRVFCE
jgi:Asp-tRNA(Asn)/Glu-tRNA(Gln) amidotransferase B subunit